MKKIALIELLASGQATRVRPDLESLRQDSGLDDLVGRLLKTTEGFLGHAADGIMSATEEELRENTRTAQIAAYVDSMAMFMSLMHYSSGEKDPPLLEKMKSEELRFAVSGDSCGNVTAAFIPGPGTLEEQISKYFAPGLSAMYARGEILLDTPHSGEYGGLAVVLRLGLKDVRKLVANANRHTNAEPVARWVKGNAPGINAVAGRKETLDYLNAQLSGTRGRFIGISDYWFHHREVLDSTYDKFLAVLKDQPLRRPEHVYISNRNGQTPSYSWQIKRDLAQSIRTPVRMWTEEGPSVVRTSNKLGIQDAVVINKEMTNWLKDSGITPHPMTDFNSMLNTRSEIYNILSREKSPSAEYSKPVLSTQQFQH